MKSFIEYCIDISEAGFEVGGKKYTYSFGRYYCDKKQISKEEYYAAKPSKPEKEKKDGKKSEEPAKDVKKQGSEEKIERDSDGRRIVTVDGYKFTLEPSAEKIFNSAFDSIKKSGKNYKIRYENYDLIIDTDKFADDSSIIDSLKNEGLQISKPRWAGGDTYRIGETKSANDAVGYIRTSKYENHTYKDGLSIKIKMSPVIDSDFPKQSSFDGEDSKILRHAMNDDLKKMTNNRCYFTLSNDNKQLVLNTYKTDKYGRQNYSNKDYDALDSVIRKFSKNFKDGIEFANHTNGSGFTFPSIQIKETLPEPKKSEGKAKIKVPTKQKSKTDFGKLEWEDSHDIAYDIGDVLGGEWSTIDDKEIAFEIDPDEILTRDNKLRPSIKKKLEAELEKIKEKHGIECDWEYNEKYQEFILKVI